MSKIAVDCRGLSKQYNGEVALEGLDLSVHAGEILAVLGPSGCGKTTSLRLIAGFENPDAGSITLADRVVANGRKLVPPEKRGIGMVFQDYALFPHLTVFENVAFGLHRRSRSQKQADVRSMLKLVGLENLAQRFPHELSGGQRQRVALARALAPRPILVLLDEPFSNLDADRRSQMREEVRVILKGIKATAIFVTHDQEEALYMGDRLAVLNHGRLEQIGTPEQVFHQPATRFVAEFMGSTDFLPGEVTAAGIHTEIGLLEQPVDLPIGAHVEIALRPDDISFERQAGSQSMVLARHFQGAQNIYRLRLPSGRLVHALQPHTRLIAPGTPVRVSANPGHRLACFYQGEALKPAGN
ncbi:MAG: ABC transporter ATP-binding protein [Anaerolineae bacterium]|nr:ABC transporter ATP-binding protein [Anaerolineae bacterium]